MDFGVFICIWIDMEFIILFLFPLVSTCNGLTGANVCARNQTQSGKLEVIKYCCNGFQEKNNMCVECSPGLRGYNCNETCPEKHYGKNCANSCKCNDTQICHHACGCIQKPIRMDNITTNNTEVISSYSVETCFSSTDTSTDSTGETNVQTTRLRQDSPNQGYFSNVYFFVTLSGSALVLLVVVGLLSCYCSRKKRSASGDHHNPVNGEEERNRSMDNHTGPEDSGEALFGTCDSDCYSTLVLRVNFESVRPLDETSEVTYLEDNLYASVMKCKREDGN